MNNILKSLLCTLLWVVFVYCCIAFLCWQWNPDKWGWNERYFMVTFGFILGAIIVWAVFFLTPKKSENAHSIGREIHVRSTVFVVVDGINGGFEVYSSELTPTLIFNVGIRGMFFLKEEADGFCRYLNQRVKLTV